MESSFVLVKGRVAPKIGILFIWQGNLNKIGVAHEDRERFHLYAKSLIDCFVNRLL